MKIQLLSDLHLESDPGFRPKAADDVDILILAGDIGSYQERSQLASDDFGLTQFSPLQESARWKRVFFTPGNHEFDGLDYQKTYQRLKDLCLRLGIEWLEKEVIVVEHVRFLGTTLWSDFDALSSPNEEVGSQLKKRDKAFRAANFYLKKYSTLRDGVRMLAPELRELGLESQRWLREELQNPFWGKTVVVTHFAPSLRSADPRYGLVPGTAGFCNSLDEIFGMVDYWIHGHLHCHNDYLVDKEPYGGIGVCRVLANPRGYSWKGEQEDFRDPMVINI